MTDEMPGRFSGIDKPRPLSEEFRAGLEHALVHGDDGGKDLMAAIETPRALPPQLRDRIEAAILLRRPHPVPRWVTTTIAAASVLIVLAGSGILLAGRPSPVPPPPSALRAFRSAGEFLGYVRGQGERLTDANHIRSLTRQRDVSLGPAPDTEFQAEFQQGTFSRALAERSLTSRAPAERSLTLAPVAPAAGRDFSGTNVQEQGVDEPDLVDTDGRRLAVMTPHRVWLLEVKDGSGRVAGSVDLAEGIGVFLNGDRLIHIGSTSGDIAANTHGSPAASRSLTKVTVVDIGHLSTPTVVATLKVEGRYVGARLAKGVVRLVVQSPALGPPLTQPAEYTPKGLSVAEAANKAAVRRSVVGNWLPHFVVERPKLVPQQGHVHDWNAISRPPDQSGVSMLTVMTIDPAAPSPNNAASVMGAGDIIYSSLTSLYVTSSPLNDLTLWSKESRPKSSVTRIHKFDISDPSRARYVASGDVPGYLLNQFSMSEHKGSLRVASTLRFSGIGASESVVTVLSQKNAELVRVGSVGNLGKGERIYSVRFIGPMGYVVTFRQVDPLYVVDIRDPRSPKVRGELKIPGFSSYLHPISDTQLIGVGRAADAAGRTGGLQFSLFDVSNPAKPTRLHERIVGTEGYSDVENDHHGFLYWAPKGLMALPGAIYEGNKEFRGALVMKVSAKGGFGEPRRLTHASRRTPEDFPPSITRTLVIGSRLITVSDTGLLFSDIDSLADRSWVPLKD